MVLYLILALLTLLSLGLMLWQWGVAVRFPLHRRTENPDFMPGVTLLKPLKGCDAETATCLRSWLTQDYAGAVQILFGVASESDPVGDLVRALLAEFPQADAHLVICSQSWGANAKISTLVQLEPKIQHELIIVSDADVRVPPDLLRQIVPPLRNPEVGLVNCFYRFANPLNLAMRWEAFAVNADFWSQVLQAKSLRPLDFALGAVMATTSSHLNKIGGFETLVDYLADDYQLGHKIAATGARIELSPLVVQCWHAPMNWREAWSHQLRWARTIRICQPVPYFFSILSNATLWPLVWFGTSYAGWFSWPLRWELKQGAEAWALEILQVWPGLALIFCLFVRIVTSLHLEARLAQSFGPIRYFWIGPFKDLTHFVIWAMSFVGNRVKWRGATYRVQAGGKLSRK